MTVRDSATVWPLSPRRVRTGTVRWCPIIAHVDLAGWRTRGTASLPSDQSLLSHQSLASHQWRATLRRDRWAGWHVLRGVWRESTALTTPVACAEWRGCGRPPASPRSVAIPCRSTTPVAWLWACHPTTPHLWSSSPRVLSSHDLTARRAKPLAGGYTMQGGHAESVGTGQSDIRPADGHCPAWKSCCFQLRGRNNDEHWLATMFGNGL